MGSGEGLSRSIRAKLGPIAPRAGLLIRTLAKSARQAHGSGLWVVGYSAAGRLSGRSGGTGSRWRGTQVVQDLAEQGGVGIALGEGDPDAAHAQADLGADFQQLQPNAAALSPCQLGTLQAEPTQGAQEHIGKGGER